MVVTCRLTVLVLSVSISVLPACCGNDQQDDESTPVSVTAAVKVDKKKPSSVVIQVESVPEADIDVEVTRTSSGGEVKEAKTDKKGRASVRFSDLKEGLYFAKVRVKAGQWAYAKVEFEIKGIGLTLKGRKPGGKKIGTSTCGLVLDAAGRTTLAQSAEVDYARQDGSLKGKLRLEASASQTIEVDGKKFKFKKGRADVTLDLGRLFARMPVSKVFYPPYYRSAPFEWPSASLKTNEGTLKGRIECEPYTLRSALNSYKGQAINLPGDGDGPSAAKTVAIIGSGLTVIGGSGLKLGELDYIAHKTTQTRKVGLCPYTNSRDNSRVEIPLEAEDAKITLFDRRTGQSFGSRVVKAPTRRCPSQTPTTTGIISSSPDDDKIEAVVKKMRAGLK